MNLTTSQTNLERLSTNISYELESQLRMLLSSDLRDLEKHVIFSPIKAFIPLHRKLYRLLYNI